MIGLTMKKFARYNRRLQPGYFVPYGLLCCFIFLCFWLSAQSDSISSIRALPEATILVQRFNRTGYAVWQADSLPAPTVSSATYRLFCENGLFIRVNAPGTLATISARGAGSNRTAVLWNGLSLQSPMNGVVDVSLLPIWPGDQLTVLQGGNSAAQSSGAMGGSLQVETPFKPARQGFSGQWGTAFGSYGLKTTQGGLDYTSGKIMSRLRANWHQAKNDFPFTKTGLDGKPYTTRQPNNFAEKTDVQQFNQLSVNAKNLIKTAAWWQHAFRQIPPASTESASNTWQRDCSLKAIATWEHHRQHSNLQSSIAWQDEFIGFHFAGVTENSRAQTARVSLEWRDRPSPRSNWRLGANVQQLRARSDGYQDKNTWYQQTRVAGYAVGERTFGKSAAVSLALRQEWISDQAAPFTGTLGWEIPVWHLGQIRGHFSRNFNLPTFNDRFWETLDNSSLAPEKGYSADLGWLYKTNHFSLEISSFQLLLDDWILWQPGTDGIFRPGNLRKVNSRGIETTGTTAFEWGKMRWKASVRMQWSETKNVATYGGATSVLGKQLIYTPGVIGGGNVSARIGGFSGAYLHQYTGARFITSDNGSKLPGFQTGTLDLGYELATLPWWRWSKSIVCHVSLENIWNVTYESLANRPMPGRNWRAGIVVGW